MNLVNVLLQTNQCNILRKFSFLNIPNIKTLDNREFSIKNFYNNNDDFFDTYNSKSINDESIQIKDIIENYKILETAKAHNDYNSIEEGQYLYFIKSTNPTRDVSYINDNQSVKKEKETIFFTKKIKKKKRGPKPIYFDRGGKIKEEQEKIEKKKKMLDDFLNNELKSKIFDKKLNFINCDSCSICCDNFIIGQSEVSITPCGHIFHHECIEK